LKEKKERILPLRFLLSPLEGTYPLPMSYATDWFAIFGIAFFCVAVFALPWIKITFSAFNWSKGKEFGLFESPWAWSMVAVLLLIICGIWFVQTRGYMLIGAGVYCLIFNVIFYIGAWKKINGIIGDIVRLARSIPFIGEILAKLVESAIKEHLSVKVSLGYWLFIPAGILLIISGIARTRKRPAEP